MDDQTKSEFQPIIRENDGFTSGDVECSSDASSSSSSETEGYNEDSESDGDQTRFKNKSLDMICMSPPTSRTVLKNHKKKGAKTKTKSRHKPKTKTSKRPILINSASNLKADACSSNLADSLTELQSKHERAQSIFSELEKSVSAPSTGILTANNFDFNNADLKEKKLDPPVVDMDPFDRAENYKKISLLLKLALCSHNKSKTSHDYAMPTPPPPPSTSLINTSTMNTLFQPTCYSSNPSSMPNPIGKSSQSEADQLLRQCQAENVWKHIYDFFEHFEDRSIDTELIDRRLAEARSAIPATIQNVFNSNFNEITVHMNQEIEAKYKTPLDYSNLNENKNYIDQLCYLYWLVEDVINRIGYIESLYPSLRLLKLNQPSYASQSFEATTKTLLLWYKTMSELMSKCDLMGKFLGFAKKPESKESWTWFDLRLSFAKNEYEKVQKWLDQNFTDEKLTNQVKAGVKPQMDAQFMQCLQPPLLKQNRQVSFELHATKSSNDLLYNNFDNSSQSVLETNGNSNIFSLSFSTNSIENNADLANISEFESSLEGDHLQTAKFHHLNSFLSRSSKSNESPPQSLSANIYQTLQLNTSGSGAALSSNTGSNTNLTVGFNLNDSNASESQYMSAIGSPNLIGDFEMNQAHNSVGSHRGSLEATPRQKIFAEFLHKRLRKHGLTKTCDEIRKIVMDTLPHVMQALQIDHCERHTSADDDHFNYHLMPLHRKCRDYMLQFPYDEETIVYGVRCESFKRLGLPTFRPLYLYLTNVILELMHMCIKMQIENKRDMKMQSNFKFSLLSIEVLTHECRECIEQAILGKYKFYSYNYIHCKVKIQE